MKKYKKLVSRAVLYKIKVCTNSLLELFPFTNINSNYAVEYEYQRYTFFFFFFFKAKLRTLFIIAIKL